MTLAGIGRHKFPEPKSVDVNVETTLLQIVDMQYDFCNPQGALYSPMVERNLPNIKELLEKARDFDMFVIHQNSHAYPTPGEKRWKTLRGSFFGWFGPEIDELKPVNRPKEYIIPKTTHDIFFHTIMDDLLNTIPEVDTVIVTGVATNVCVMYTVAGYCIRGYKVIVPMDCVISKNEEIQAMALHVMANLCPAFPATMTTSKMISFKKMM